MSQYRGMRAIGLNLAVAVAYAVVGWLGLQFPYYGSYVTLLWAATGIALVAVIVAGPIVTPGVFLGSFGLNLSIEPAFPGKSALIAVANALAPLLAGMVLVRWCAFRPQLDRVRDALAYIAVGVVGTGLITASMGTLCLAVAGLVSWVDFGAVWLGWFAGEACGSLVVGPFLLSMFSTADPVVSRGGSPIEKAAMIISVVVVSSLVLGYGGHFHAWLYAFAPVLVWIVLRSDLRGTSLAVVAVMLTLVVGTALGLGPYVVGPASSEMLSLWMYLTTVCTAVIIGRGLIAERDRALHHQQRLVAELDHRVKNTLATVVALAERSREGSESIDDYSTRFIGRVHAIARTHEGLARANWEPMAVRDVVTMTLAPFDGTGPDHMAAGGDAAILTASDVAPLTMVLHELATNAAKYGAWSRVGGRVVVAWEQIGEDTLRLRWNESGGPPVSTQPVRGFGLYMIEGLVGHQLGGDAEIEFRRDGLVCTLTVPGAIFADVSSSDRIQ